MRGAAPPAVAPGPRGPVTYNARPRKAPTVKKSDFHFELPEALIAQAPKLRVVCRHGVGYDLVDVPALTRRGMGAATSALLGVTMRYADEAVIITNPEVSSVRDSDRILGMLGSKTQRAIDGKEPVKEHLLITRYNPNRVADGQMLSLEDIQDILRIKLIGVIPESEAVLQASNQGLPAVHLKGTDVAGAYSDVVERFLGETDKPMRYIEAEKPGFFKRLFGGK